MSLKDGWDTGLHSGGLVRSFVSAALLTLLRTRTQRCKDTDLNTITRRRTPPRQLTNGHSNPGQHHLDM